MVVKGTMKKGTNAARRTATAVASAGGSPAKRRGSSAKLRGPATKKATRPKTNAKPTTVAAAMKLSLIHI